MNINAYKTKKGLSYEELGRVLELSTSKTFRICNKKIKINIEDVKKIVNKTNGEVTVADFME